MAEKKLVLILKSSSEYIKYSGEDTKRYLPQLNRFFESMNSTYLPLLDMCERLENENVPFKFGLVLSPVVCSLFDDAEIQEQYLVWLENRIEVGRKELEKSSYSPELADNAQRCLSYNQKAKEIYSRYKGKLNRKFLEFHKKGMIELLATCGTDVFLPHYNDIPEVLNAQVETGFFSYKAFFGEIPDGFWLPELGYYPGVESFIRRYGFNYTVLDARSFLFSESAPVNGIFSPARFENSLVAFCRDNSVDKMLFDSEEGYAYNPLFLETKRDIGFELSQEELLPYFGKDSPRYSLGYRYWSRFEDENIVYDQEKAGAKVSEFADDFLSKKSELLNTASSLLPEEKSLSLLVTLDLDFFRAEWAEGLFWIENLFRKASSYDLSFELAKNLIENQYSLQRIKPCYGSDSPLGYGEELLSSKNNWMMRYIRKASERMVDLSDRFPDDTGLKARLLNLGAKELLLAQSSGWAKMIESDDFPEYAEMRFKQGINDFTAVFDALGSKTVSTEWLTRLENTHQIFPWMNYKIFCKKTY